MSTDFQHSNTRRRRIPKAANMNEMSFGVHAALSAGRNGTHRKYRAPARREEINVGTERKDPLSGKLRRANGE